VHSALSAACVPSSHRGVCAWSCSYRLAFASNFSGLLAPLTNNYAKYAVESLVFVGSELYVRELT
jgi:hypothetical protein